MPRILKAQGPTVLSLLFDPARIAALRPEEREAIAYHFTRLIAGEGTAAEEWEHWGMRIHLRAPKGD